MSTSLVSPSLVLSSLVRSPFARAGVVRVAVWRLSLVHAVAGVVAAGVLLTGGCAAELTDSAPSSSSSSALLGVSGPGDFADRGCQIVLRDIGRVSSTSGYATDGSRWIFEGRVDVADAALAEGAEPFLLARAGSDPAWREHPPIAAVGIDGKRTRFLFHLSEGDLPGPGISSTGLARTKVEVIPFLRSFSVAGESRLFDHNRMTGDFDTYVLRQDNGFSVAENLAVCAPQWTTLTFHADWTEETSGPLIAGDDVVVRYDMDRLPNCRARSHGGEAWSIVAHARFSDGSQSSAPLISRGRSVPGRLHVPTGVSSMSVWFENADAHGCVAYDSNYGRNYVFDLEGDIGPTWMGEVTAQISRGADAPCTDGSPVAGEVRFDSWARQRAVHTNLCFQVYEPGLTDRNNPDLWRALDVQVHTRADPDSPFTSQHVDLAGRVGNNALYGVNLRPFDVFAPHRCLSVPTSTEGEGEQERITARLELFVTVNGARLGGEDHSFFVRYEDYASVAHPLCD